MSIIQILYHIKVDMKSYIKAVNNKCWDFPDFNHTCPICGGENCNVRIGFYFRKHVIIDFKLFKSIPIARYLCRKKGPRKSKHRTFSLLPHQLIPYRKNGLSVVFETVKYQHKNNAPYGQIKSFIGNKGKDDYLSLENKQIDDFRNIVAQACSKMMTVDKLKKQLQNYEWYQINDPVANMINLIEKYNSPLIKTNNLSQAEKLSLDFFSYFQKGNYVKRHFLFGTNSQKRS